MLHLRELRQEKNLTQADLSKILKISASAIGMYEQGRREPDNDTLSKIADFFDVSIDYLLGQSAYRARLKRGLLGSGFKQAEINPPPSYFTDPETRALMEKMQNDPHHRRIFLASKDLKPDELDRIADLMETIINARKSKEEPL